MNLSEWARAYHHPKMARRWWRQRTLPGPLARASARNRTLKALRCAQRDVGPAGIAAVGGRVGREDIG
jgi:hypothetical protein